MWHFLCQVVPIDILSKYLKIVIIMGNDKIIKQTIFKLQFLFYFIYQMVELKLALMFQMIPIYFSPIQIQWLQLLTV